MIYIYSRYIVMIDHVTPPTLIESKSAAENGHGRWFKAHGPLQGFSPISESSALSPSGGAYPVRKKLPGLDFAINRNWGQTLAPTPKPRWVRFGIS